MSTTTPDEGAATAAQPQESAAVTDSHEDDQVIVTDANGTPSLEPVASKAQSEEQAVTEEAPAEEAEAEPETQAEAADKTDEEVAEWAAKKGLKIDPANPNEVRLARMQLETDRKFHETRQVKSAVQPPELLPDSEDFSINEVIQRQNETDLKLYVRDWLDNNPEAKEHQGELRKIAIERPWLTNMDDVYAHFLANPSRANDLRKEGGKEALTNLAQKQSQVPPSAGATNTGVYASAQITPTNVYDLVDKHDQAWFEKNHKAISDAMAGKSPQ